MKKNKKNKAVFLDRDGTILNERGYLSDPQKMRFYASSFSALRKLQTNKYLLVVITNQSGIGRGYFSLAQYNRLNSAFLKKLKSKGIRIRRVYFCPDHPSKKNTYRKPNPKMINNGIRELKIDPRQSFMVGDQMSDILAGIRAKVRPILVKTGKGKSVVAEAKRKGALVFPTLNSAAQFILKKGQQNHGSKN